MGHLGPEWQVVDRIHLQYQPYWGDLKSCLFVRNIPGSGTDGYLGQRSDNCPSFLFWGTAFAQHLNYASELCIPHLSTKEIHGLLFPLKINLIQKWVFAFAVLTFKIFVNFINIPDKTWRCPNRNRNQSSVTIWRWRRGKLLYTTNSGFNLSLWLRVCHNNLFLFFRKEEQHLAFL